MGEISIKLFQDWGECLKKELKDFILEKIDEYEAIWVVGSRVIGGFHEKSDLDVLLFGSSLEKTQNYYWNNLRISIHPKKEKKNLAYGKFSPSYYDLLSDTYIKGPDDEKYKEWKKNQYK